MNIVRNAFEAQTAAYDQGEKMRRDQARVQAGRQMERGGPEAAAGTLYAAGDLEGGAGMQQMQQQGQERELKLQQAESAKKLEYMKRLGVAMQGIPMEQRAQAYQEKVGPALQQLGMSPEDVAGAAAHLDDASLMTFIGELDKQLQVINLGGGGVASYNKQTGEFKTLREPTQKAPNGYRYGLDGNLEIDPGYVAGQGQVADVKASATARYRAPRVGRSGGGRAGIPPPPGNPVSIK